MPRGIVPDPALSKNLNEWAQEIKRYLSFPETKAGIQDSEIGIEYTHETKRAQGRPVYYKYMHVVGGPNGTPAAPAFINTAHNVAGPKLNGFTSIHSGIFVLGAASFRATPNYMLLPPALFGAVNAIHVDLTNLVWETNWNASFYSLFVFWEYQKS